MNSRRPGSTAAAMALGTSMMMIGLAGCSSPTPQENVSQACEAADAFGTALQEVRSSLTPEATVDELRTARNQLADSYEDLLKESGDVAEDRLEELDTNVDGFRDAVDEIDDDTKVPDAVDSLRNEANDVETAMDNLRSELNC
ncbi:MULTISPECIES: hypothetical protein [Micrococcaceae]|uniref:hypothetical protein n=1 Tax=Micrococcaceae TaxID=1268 RepID=UPI001610ADD2|nr:MULTISPECIES: hypothetical protein [Micrococcaceae]MBB5748150.1 ElaB/YqjD/DUF883 family membrane-anchored ribosome-binding protein [Micrococcus sp. TA1]HRO30993.1 hypothetical protein [Citricoccus sp.]HRO92518.1 hypothetical protein [Citricoccus sp.]